MIFIPAMTGSQDFSMLTAKAEDIMNGKTAYTSSGKTTGIYIPPTVADLMPSDISIDSGSIKWGKTAYGREGKVLGRWDGDLSMYCQVNRPSVGMKNTIYEVNGRYTAFPDTNYAIYIRDGTYFTCNMSLAEGSGKYKITFSTSPRLTTNVIAGDESKIYV